MLGTAGIAGIGLCALRGLMHRQLVATQHAASYRSEVALWALKLAYPLVVLHVRAEGASVCKGSSTQAAGKGFGTSVLVHVEFKVGFTDKLLTVGAGQPRDAIARTL